MAKISLQELFVCKYLWPALAPLLSNPGKLMNREHRSTARGGHVSLCIRGILNLEFESRYYEVDSTKAEVCLGNCEYGLRKSESNIGQIHHMRA